ncbi:MAG: GntR family transcriptional regulator [Lysobacteraceae bacterium]
MNASQSKSAFLYRQVRRALQAGRYPPGHRIDPASLAAEFNTSPTPVRFALYRLVGEGQVTDYGRAGLRVPLPSEVALRDQYDWMQRLLNMACDIGFDHVSTPPAQSGTADGDVVKRTWQLFDAIARGTGHRSLHQAVRMANDRLAPIRRAKQHLIEDADAEIRSLERHWQDGDLRALRAALNAYHERRKKLVPCIVAVVTEQVDPLH